MEGLAALQVWYMRQKERRAASVERLEPPARCCSRGVYRHVSVDASKLSRTGLRLFVIVRCVVLSRARRGEHPP